MPLGSLPPYQVSRFVDTLDRVAGGRLNAARAGPEFVAALRTLVAAAGSG